MAFAAFAAGSFLAPPVQQAIAAVIATDVQCAGCVGTSDVAGNAITAAKIKDNEVKAAEIATDAVGAAELQGVTKLMFAKCALTSHEAGGSVPAGSGIVVNCTINGVVADDQVIATGNYMNSCIIAAEAEAGTGKVALVLHNTCSSTQAPGTNSFVSLVVYHK